MRRTHEGQHGADCFGCKVQTVQMDTRAMPSRRNNVPPKVNKDANAWNRGIVKDSRGMPLLKADLTEIGVKDYADNRSKYEEARRRLANSS